MTGLIRLIKEKVKSFDRFGREFIFEEKDSQSYKTSLGGVFTLILFVIVTIIGFIFGKEIFLRKTPNITSSEELVSYNETMIKITDVPIIITFHTYDGSPLIEIDRILELSSHKFSFDHNLKINLESYDGFSDCDAKKYGIHEKYVEKTVNESRTAGHTVKCLATNDDFYFMNSYSASNSQFLNFQIKMCNSSKINHNCHPDLITQTNQIYVLVRTISAYINPTDYENPITYYEESVNQQIGNQFLKRTFFRFAQNALETDSGWIIENKEIQKYISLKNIKQDINPTYGSEMYWITLESPSLRHKTRRVYIKTQELIATIGGLFNGIFIFFSIVTHNFVKYRFYANINNFLQIKEEAKDLSSPFTNIAAKSSFPSKDNKKEDQTKVLNLNKKQKAVAIDKITVNVSQNMNSSKFNIINFFKPNRASSISYWTYQFVPIFSICCSKKMKNIMNSIMRFEDNAKSLICFNSYMKISYNNIRDKEPFKYK